MSYGRYRRLVILLVVVGVFLGIRKWLDGKREEIQDIEIVRDDMDEGDAHLGRWAQKNDDALIQFRLKRDGTFSYEVVEYPGKDTIRHTGRHEIIPTVGYDGEQYPRLVAVSNNGDTIINHYVYLTRATKQDVDILALKKDNHLDTPAMLFYRDMALDELEAIQGEDASELEKHAAKRDMLTAVELIDLADCTDLSCVQLFMKDLSPDFFQGKKGEFYSGRRSAVIDTAGTELTLPPSTFYVDVNPQASWRAAHTVHTKALGDALYNEFMQLGFEFVDEGYYLGIKSKQQRYISKKYPGKSMYLTATFNPWGFKGLYENKVTWPCYVFEVYRDE